MTPIVQSVRVPPSLRARRREKKNQNVTGGKRLLIHWRTPPYPLRGCRKHLAFFNRLFFSLGCVCVCVREFAFVCLGTLHLFEMPNKLLLRV